MMHVLLCPECGTVVPPTFVEPAPRIYQCRMCFARTPRAELKSMKHRAVVRTDDSGGGGGRVYAQLAITPKGTNTFLDVTFATASLSVASVVLPTMSTLVVCVVGHIADPGGGGDLASAPTSVVFGSQQLVKILDQQGAYNGPVGVGDFRNMSIWYLSAPIAGTQNVTATWSPKVAEGFILVNAIGQSSNIVFDQSASQAGDVGRNINPPPRTGSTGALAASREACIAFAYDGDFASPGGPWDSGFSDGQSIQNPTILDKVYDATLLESGLSTVSTSPTVPSSEWICGLVTFYG